MIDFITIKVVDDLYRYSLTTAGGRSWFVRRRNKKYCFRVTVLAIATVTGKTLAWATKHANKGLWFPEETPIYVGDDKLITLMEEWRVWLESLKQPRLSWWQMIFRHCKDRKSAQSN